MSGDKSNVSSNSISVQHSTISRSSNVYTTKSVGAYNEVRGTFTPSGLSTTISNLFGVTEDSLTYLGVGISLKVYNSTYPDKLFFSGNIKLSFNDILFTIKIVSDTTDYQVTSSDLVMFSNNIPSCSITFNLEHGYADSYSASIRTTYSITASYLSN